MNKINKILLAVVAILIIVLVAIIFWQKYGFQNSYYAVYLNTGELYFGQLHWFPRFNLTNVYYIQQDVNDKENPFSLSKFSNAFWGPEDKIYLSQKNIIWKAKLNQNSDLLNFLKNPTQISAPSQSSFPQNQSTSTQSK